MAVKKASSGSKSAKTTKTQKNQAVNSLWSVKRFSRTQYLIFFGLLIILGVVIFAVRAGSSPWEAEGWSRTGNTTASTDGSASAGQYITFNPAVTTTTVTPSPSTTAFTTTPGRYIPDTLYGVTIESVSNLAAVNTALSKHTKRPTTRIVFQKGDAPSAYTNAVSTLRNTSYIMGEILDSTALGKTSVADYKLRTADYVNTFKNNIDIWEVGNELNGAWVGSDPAVIRSKVKAAYDVVEVDNKALGLRSAITLNYWPSSNCYGKSWEVTQTFADALAAAYPDIKNGVDYIFLSFYETACTPPERPTVEQFKAIFKSLSVTFPNAKLGMGEIGAQGQDDEVATPSLAKKQDIAKYYYGMNAALKSTFAPGKYVGGYFWWYYYQDAVPFDKSNSMWSSIEQAFNGY